MLLNTLYNVIFQKNVNYIHVMPKLLWSLYNDNFKALYNNELIMTMLIIIIRIL